MYFRWSLSRFLLIKTCVHAKYTKLSTLHSIYQIKVSRLIHLILAKQEAEQWSNSNWKWMGAIYQRRRLPRSIWVRKVLIFFENIFDFWFDEKNFEISFHTVVMKMMTISDGTSKITIFVLCDISKILFWNKLLEYLYIFCICTYLFSK